MGLSKMLSDEPAAAASSPVTACLNSMAPMSEKEGIWEWRWLDGEMEGARERGRKGSVVCKPSGGGPGAEIARALGDGT